MATDASSQPLQRRLALVTGASSGIGLSLAKQFAKSGCDLLVTGASEAIDGVVEELRQWGTDVQAFRADLRTSEGVESLWRWVREGERALDLAALNAGVGVGGAFSETDLQRELDLVALNVASTVHLSKRLVQSMCARGKGRILFTSSISSEMRSPFEAVYGASKSFIQSFAHSLREELKGTGVSVTVFLPGPTETNFFHRAEMDDTRVGAGKKDDPDQVARQAYLALMAGLPQLHTGSVKTRLMGVASRFLPELLKAKAHRRMSEPGGAHADA